MELAGHEEGMVHQFNHFNDPLVPAPSGKNHVASAEKLRIFIIEFITVPVPFENRFLAVNFPRFGSGKQLARMEPQTHGSAVLSEVDERKVRILFQAFFRPNTLTANSTIASCIPKQIPR